MPVITSYCFGRMEINQKTYSKDVLILPDGRIASPWWRRDGHHLVLDDLRDMISAKPDVIVAGTGARGLMQPSAALLELLAQYSIEFIAQPTAKAVQTYNNLSKTRKTGACFHLTC